MDELEIAGRRYLSTRRAAKEHKYTPDYVGQLIRGGKVVGKKVGRSWYVEEASLNAYLNGEAAPARAAAAATPVVKMQEKPIERLVEEPAFAPAPVNEVAVENIPEPEMQKEEIKEEEKTFEPVVVKTKNLEEHHIPIRTTVMPVQEKPVAGLRYVVDDEPALPEIKRKVTLTTAPAVSVRREVAEAPHEEEEREEYAEIILNKKIGTFAIVGLVIAGIATLSATAVLSATLSSRIVVEQGQVASVGYSFQ